MGEDRLTFVVTLLSGALITIYGAVVLITDVAKLLS